MFVVPEMADFADAAGGLGDVAAGSRALRRRYDVRVLIPGYRDVLARAGKLQKVGRVPAQAGLPACDIGRLEQSDGLPVYVLLCAALFEREGTPYVDAEGQEWPDNALRFATLSHVAAEIAAAGAPGSIGGRSCCISTTGQARWPRPTCWRGGTTSGAC